MKIYKYLFGFVVAIATVTLAYYAGVEASNYFQKQNILNQRNSNNKSILSQMNDLKIGDTTPNYSFEDLSFQPIMLQPLVSKKTVLIFIEPDCPSCVEDIERLSKIIQDESDASHFIIISSGNPRHLIDLRNEYNLSMPILYDHDRGYSSIFGVFTYPFHIVIDESMQVLDIITGPLVENDIRDIIKK